jgi:hypothetical protein
VVLDTRKDLSCVIAHRPQLGCQLLDWVPAVSAETGRVSGHLTEPSLARAALFETHTDHVDLSLALACAGLERDQVAVLDLTQVCAYQVLAYVNHSPIIH